MLSTYMHATVVTGSRRLARLLREQHDEHEAGQGRAVWVAPKILPWSAWIGELWESAVYCGAADPAPVRLGAEAGRALWERVISESPEADSLLQISATAGAAADAWELMHAWRLDRADLEAHASEDTQAFVRWAREFECVCAREGWIDHARLPDYLAERLPSLTLPSEIVLAGCDELTPQQNDFIEACRRAGTEIRSAEPPVATTAAQIARTPFPDRGKEIEAAARWVRSLLESGATNIGVAMRGLSELRPQVERTFAEVLDPASALPGSDSSRPLFNISAGPALSSCPLVCSALLALELTPGKNDVGLVSRLLRSPFFGGADAEWTARAALDARLRALGGTECSFPVLERLCSRYNCPELAQALSAWRRERQQVPMRQRPADWARTFSVLVAKLGWPGDRGLSSEDYQTVQAWSDLLSGFAALETVLGEVPYGDALRRLKRMAGDCMFQPETGPAPVQILGMLDTAGRSFDHLWIAGLEDDCWPGPSKPVAFLPAALQRQVPHASPERELAFARLITERLLASAPDVVLSHALHEGDRELGPSPLIRHIPEVTLVLPEYPSYLDAVRRSSNLETLDDHSAPPVAESIVSGGTRLFQCQAECPFRAFAEVRLGARPLETPEPGLSASERGRLVHMALELVWGELKSHARLTALGDELQPLVHAAVLRAMDAMADRRGSPLAPRFGALEGCRVEARVLEWLTVERGRAPFTVVRPEGERYAGIGGINVRVTLDRVDRLDDGREVIVDYKTGHIKPHCWEGERPDEPQLPLYAVTHNAPLAAVVFGKVRAGDVGFQGFQDGAGIPGVQSADLGAEITEWRRVLENLAADFRSGVAEVNPKDASTCRHCSLAALCRIAEAEIATSALTGETSNA